MKLARRKFLAMGIAALPAVSRVAWAQSYPTRPIRLVIGFPAGSATDIIGRLVAHWLAERLGQPVVIDNRPGAGSNIATEAVAKAAPDGYTLLLGGTANAVNATLYSKLNFNFVRDIAPIATLLRQPSIMVANPSVPAKTVPEFIAYAKANPGRINMASSGIGTTPHIAGELFKIMAGLDIVHVPYRGSAPALTDLFAGQVQLIFLAPSASLASIKEGKLRPLAVTTATRSELLPDIPTVADFLPGYEATAWTGIFAPTSTPGQIVDRLNKEINAGLADPKMRARLADLGGGVLASSPAEFGKLIADETEKWAKVIKTAGVKPE
jgi:tripartite-type tricarboxylate transporter receptor subunit TctC